MSFTLGGPGDILPPRAKQPSNQPTSRQIADQQSGGFKDPRKQPVKSPLTLVQQSVPRDVPPTTKPTVAAGKQPVVLPQSTPTAVTRIADRKPATKAEAIQSAIAQATGNVIPLPNIKDITDKLRPGVMNADGTWPTPVGPQPLPTNPIRRPGLSKEGLCTAVGIIEAQRHGNSITLSGNEGKMRVLAGEELVAAAKSAAALVQKALDAGDVSKQDIADCQVEYCKRAQCPADHSTGVAEKPPADAPPVPTPSEALPPVTNGGSTSTSTPATPPGTELTTTTSSTGTASNGGTATIPDALLPPALPPATSNGGGGGGAIAPVILPPSTLPPTVSVEPLTIAKDAPKTGMSTATKGFLWVAAAVAAYTLFKKLSGVKVVGAAMAGVPLVADMGDEDEDENEDGDEGDDAGHADEAHETDSEENEE